MLEPVPVVIVTEHRWTVLPAGSSATGVLVVRQTVSVVLIQGGR